MGDQWDLVGGDPAPGDPGWIQQHANTLGQIAEEAGGCREQLDAIVGQWASSDWRGPASEVFRSRIGTVVPDLSKASASYGTASSTLGRFASTLSDLQAAAGQALSRAQSAQSRLSNANSAASEGRRQVAALAQEQRAISEEIAVLARQIQVRQQQLGPQAAADPTLQTWQRLLQQQESSMTTTLAQSRQAEELLAGAENDAVNAQSVLASARWDIENIRTEFDRAVRQAVGELEEAAAQGIKNLSFWRQEFNHVKTEVDGFSAHVLRDEKRYVDDLSLVATGHLSGLRNLADWVGHDVVAAAPEIHVLTHAWAEAGDALVDVVSSLGPVLPIACVVVGAIAGSLIPGVGTAVGANLGDMASDDISADVDEFAAAGNLATAGSEKLLEVDGRGNQAAYSQDMSNFESDGAGFISEEAGSIASVVPVPDHRACQHG
jgi:hypothetical protein